MKAIKNNKKAKPLIKIIFFKLFFYNNIKLNPIVPKRYSFILKKI